MNANNRMEQYHVTEIQDECPNVGRSQMMHTQFDIKLIQIMP